ncbi:DUF1345 domain-containing protein [Siculibacillus lacustris]|uniref:DUF1345 domain-containing protein n=1 Tax=Siculibacillus lacustris TaxID=1549641 RepID=A0A4Q9VN21_9HYPH|nr:DUF1345 domain-containing protein [Siculibacillus lacustris]TBW37009.1 DUF1345 domain-containing protein [Siculibacillus lacustris]
MPKPDATPAPRHRRLPWQALALRPHLAGAIGTAVAVAVSASLLAAWRWPTVVLVAWNVGVGLWIALTLAMMAASDDATTLRRARRLDESAGTILAAAVLAGLASLSAIVFELGIVKDLTGLPRAGHVALAALTVLTAWSFIHAMFALHYAHTWTLGAANGNGGLRIPGEDHPDYWDFLYVAVVIGTSGQTADVEFTSKRLRRIGLVHCALAFVFNTTVLALTVNIAAGLI